MEKKKILVLSDHPLSTSGVGVQSKFLIEGLIATGKYNFCCLGGAIRHTNYETIMANGDFVIKPVDGFGTKEQLRAILAQENPSAILLFTDPRQFIWVWEMEDEIHKFCPITYWHVWDNDPYPVFNKPWYDSTDLINCLSHKTYELIKPNFPEKTNYIPHAFPKSIYFPVGDENQVRQMRQQNFGHKADWFIALWINRNATRKMPGDLLDGWKCFLDKLEQKHGHRNAMLVMHTDPDDTEGPNLMMVAEHLGIQENVVYSKDKVEFEKMNLLHNITDCSVNISKNEGFGLGTLSSLQCLKPIVALKTGGLTRQVIDYRDNFEYGAGITPVTRKLVGSQLVPYIYEDYASQEAVANGFLKVYEMTPEEKLIFKSRVSNYIETEFNYEKIISEWDRTLTETIENWNKNKKTWSLTPIEPKTNKAQLPMSSNGQGLTEQSVIAGNKGGIQVDLPNLPVMSSPSQIGGIIPLRKQSPKILERYTKKQKEIK